MERLFFECFIEIMICAMIRLGWHPRRKQQPIPRQQERVSETKLLTFTVHHIKTQRKVLLLFKSSEEFAMIQVQLGLKCYS